jgi:hypothetical protein
MSVFDEIVSAETTEGGNYITKDGRYTFVVTKIGVNPKARKGKTFYVNLEVVESNETVAGVAPHAPGSNVSWLQVIGHADPDRRKMALGNVKKFILSLFNTPDVNPTELHSTLKELLGPDETGAKEQPARGFTIKGETYQKPTKAGSPRMYVNFFGVENTPADVKKRRQALESAEAELTE